MEKTKKHCLHCTQGFVCKRNPAQRYCGTLGCQNARKREWRKEKLKQDPDYRLNQKRANERWHQQDASYWQRYRKNHPDYTDRNRQQQRVRDQKRAQISQSNNASHLAKSDALGVVEITQPLVTSGLYQLLPITRSTRPNLAKSDALMVQLSVITQVSPSSSQPSAILQRDHLIGGALQT